MIKKKIKINPKNYLFWLYSIGFLCAFLSVATVFDKSNDFITKVIAFIASWWIFLVTFHFTEDTSKQKIKELVEEMKKRDDEWYNLVGDINKYDQIEGQIEEKELDQLTNEIERIEIIREERMESGYDYISGIDWD